MGKRLAETSEKVILVVFISTFARRISSTTINHHRVSSIPLVPSQHWDIATRGGALTSSCTWVADTCCSSSSCPAHVASPNSRSPYLLLLIRCEALPSTFFFARGISKRSIGDFSKCSIGDYQKGSLYMSPPTVRLSYMYSCTIKLQYRFAID